MTLEHDILERTLTVTNKLGIHARVATMMVKTMRQFSSQVTLAKDGVEADARSVLGLLLLSAAPGSEILVRAAGANCQEVMREIARLIQEEDED